MQEEFKKVSPDNSDSQSREIKFRVWDKQKNKWVDNSEYHKTELNYETNFLEHMNYFHIMQYTGLKDRNGVEIYEGDVVKRKPRGYKRNIKTYIVYCNKYGTSGYITKYKNGWDYIDDDMYVIGNIYQNPELLSEK